MTWDVDPKKQLDWCFAYIVDKYVRLTDEQRQRLLEWYRRPDDSEDGAA